MKKTIYWKVSVKSNKSFVRPSDNTITANTRDEAIKKFIKKHGKLIKHGWKIYRVVKVKHKN